MGTQLLLCILCSLPGSYQESNKYAGRSAFKVSASGNLQHVVLAKSIGDRYSIPIPAAGVSAGQSVADIGCGSGKHAFELARIVGPQGKVSCRDISKDAIKAITDRAKQTAASNIDAAVNRKDRVDLPESSIDVALLSDVFHYVIHQKNARPFCESLLRAMKPGGVVVVSNVTNGQLFQEKQWKRTVSATREAFVAVGFEPGAGWQIDDGTRRPAIVQEFRKPTRSENNPLRRIMFGSCIKQMHPAPILGTIAKQHPDLFIFLGDNIYGDTDDMAVMRAKYKRLGELPGFKALRDSTPILATWDDHDYGRNDAGADYPHRGASQREFLKFWNEPKDSPLWKRPGIYTSRMFGPAGKRTQIILLDTRYFRSPLKKRDQRRVGGVWEPDSDPNKTMLGETQWKWLEGELRKPAEVRVVASSIQFVAEDAGQETWSNLPAERQKMIDLLRKTKANGVMFISGDRHWSELSTISPDGMEPVFDLTSSSLNQIHARGTPTKNKFRSIQATYHKPNFGVIEIDWRSPTPKVRLQIRDESNEVQIEHSFHAGSHP